MTSVIIIADGERHYEAAKALMRAEGVEPPDKLEFPTLLAFDPQTRELVGTLGTFHQDELVFCGPLVLESTYARYRTAMELANAYEANMRKMGVKSYILWVDEGNIIDQAIKRYIPDGVELYATEGKRKFYIRRLENGQQS
jgi:hypothetical protein